MGAKLSNTSRLFELGAFGTSSIFNSTYSSYLAQKNDAGAYWYMLDGQGFGFSSMPTINLQTCDVLTTEAYASRMCWHIDGYKGGYRAGSHLALDNDIEWTKVIYFNPKPISTSSSTTYLSLTTSSTHSNEKEKVKTNHCPSYTHQMPSSSSMDAVICYFMLCDASIIHISLCGKCFGHTAISMLDVNGSVIGHSRNCEDNFGSSVCTEIFYSPAATPGCHTYSIRQGCVHGYCGGTSHVLGIDGALTVFSTVNMTTTLFQHSAVRSIISNPNPPATIKTMSATLPSEMIVYCPPYISEGSHYYSYVPCDFILCDALYVHVSLCASCKALTFVDLVDSTGAFGQQSVPCFDHIGVNVCSEIYYEVPISSGCTTYSLHQGCEDGRCGGTSRILAVGGTVALISRPSISPTPTAYPTKSMSPTLQTVVSCPPFNAKYLHTPVTCRFVLCYVKEVLISQCGTCNETLTYLGLYYQTYSLAGFGTRCPDGSCSVLSYVPSAGCQTYSLLQGCWHGDCHGTSQITVTGGIVYMMNSTSPTAYPTAQLTISPTSATTSPRDGNTNSINAYLFGLIFIFISLVACCIFFCLCYIQNQRRQRLAFAEIKNYSIQSNQHNNTTTNNNYNYIKILIQEVEEKDYDEVESKDDQVIIAREQFRI